MKTRPLLLAAALAVAPLSAVAPAPAGAAVLTRVSGPQLAAGNLGAARVIASNATLPRTGRGRPYRQAAFFVVLSALVGTACGVGRNLAGRRRS
ncbi:MAG: hypothetical protein NVS3B21_15080 [Acidimicrobiales bacterium]